MSLSRAAAEDFAWKASPSGSNSSSFWLFKDNGVFYWKEKAYVTSVYAGKWKVLSGVVLTRENNYGNDTWNISRAEIQEAYEEYVGRLVVE